MALYAIQQSTTNGPLLFPLVLSSDHISPATGKSPTVVISKNGAAFGSPAGAVSELANGWYVVAGNATDSNTLGPILLHATEASSDPTDTVYVVQTLNPYESLQALLNHFADATIRRTFANALASADGDTAVFRSLLGVMAKLVNKVAVSGGTLQIMEDDDTTVFGSQTITTQAGADPIVALDTT
jgi:hypothetical protein